MLGSEVLDVAIGLVFVYLVLSLICSAACEMIESMLRRRAAYLERGLVEMLKDISDGRPLVREIYRHPLISSLFSGVYAPGKHSNLPAYIPPENFSLALMDVVGLYGNRANNNVTVSSTPFTSGPDWMRNTILANSNFSPHVSQALLVLADSANYDLVALRRNIEGWYNSSMDRVSGWYKRRSHIVVLSLGFALSLAINADTLSITNSLATDKALRSSLISAATEASRSTGATAPSDFQSDLQQIRGAGLPLGWTATSTDVRRVPQTLPEWFMKILGVALTALAISLGGPFWFDTLNRFIVVRSTVKPSEKSPNEPSKS